LTVILRNDDRGQSGNSQACEGTWPNSLIINPKPVLPLLKATTVTINNK